MRSIKLAAKLQPSVQLTCLDVHGPPLSLIPSRVPCYSDALYSARMSCWSTAHSYVRQPDRITWYNSFEQPDRTTWYIILGLNHAQPWTAWWDGLLLSSKSLLDSLPDTGLEPLPRSQPYLHFCNWDYIATIKSYIFGITGIFKADNGE